MNLERVPPHSEESERFVLGSIMSAGPRVLDICELYRIVPESFYVPAHRRVYECLLGLNAKAKPLDYLAVMQSLGSESETIGGACALERMIESVTTAAHSEYYIDIVSAKHQARKLIAECQKTEAACWETSDRSETDALIEGHQSELIRIESERMSAEPTWKETIDGVLVTAEEIANSGKSMSGLSTGFINLDRGLCGLKPKELILLAARPSQGKTSCVMNIAENIALGKASEDGKPLPVGIFSIEMSRESLANRMLCSHAGVDSYRMARGRLSGSERAKLAQSAGLLRKAPLYCDDTGGMDIQQLRIRARKWRDKHGIVLLIVDYLQLLNDKSTPKHEGRQREVSSISSSLKACAKELEIPVLALSQLNRSSELAGRNGKPRLSDLRDSGSLEQDADVVALLRRPCRFDGDPQSEDKLLAVIDIAKNRNGPVGEIEMNFVEELTRFQDRAKAIDGMPEETTEQGEFDADKF